MNKTEFIAALRQRLSYLPPEEVNGPIGFYAECIDERLEDGMTEEEAVAALGSVEDAARTIEADLPLTTLVKQRVKEKKERSGGSKTLWVVLAVVGFPVWLPLLIVAAVLVLTVFIVLWAVIVSLYAVVLGVAAGAVGGVIGGLWLLPAGWPGALFCVGGGLVCAGLAVLLFIAFTALAKGLARMSRGFWRWVKARFAGRKEKDYE